MKYFEKRFDGSRTFELQGSRLHIKGSNSLRSDFELVVDLTAVSPEYSLLRLRHRVFFFALLVLIATVAVGFAVDKMIILSGAIVLILVLMALTLKKQTFYQFSYRTGGVAFDVCEAGPEKARAAEFVRSVSAAIVAAAPRATEG